MFSIFAVNINTNTKTNIMKITQTQLETLAATRTMLIALYNADTKGINYTDVRNLDNAIEAILATKK